MSLSDPRTHVWPIDDWRAAQRADGQAADIGPTPFLAGDQDTQGGVELLECCSKVVGGHGLVTSKARGKETLG
jgi:hypothetical protein